MCADKFKEEAQRFCGFVRNMALFYLTLIAIVEMFGMSRDFRVIGRIVMTMNESSFSQLLPVIRISPAIWAKPHIHIRSIADVEAELQSRFSSSPQMLNACDDVAEFAQRNWLKNIVHAKLLRL